MRIRLAAPFFALVLFFLGERVRAEQSAADLINAVILTRVATFGQVSSGIGSASISESDVVTHPPKGREGSTTTKRQVKFSFLNDNSIVENDLNTETGGSKLSSMQLVYNGRVFSYSDDRNTLVVSAYQPVYSLALSPPGRWTYRELCRVPGVIRDDENDFIRALKKGDVSRNGNTVVAVLTHEAPQFGLHQLTHVEFDLQVGGMVKLYHSEIQHDAAGGKAGRKEVTDISFEWEHEKDLIFPKSRHGTVLVTDPAEPLKPIRTLDSLIEFATFEEKTLEKASFGIAALHVKEGTTMIDTLTNKMTVYASKDAQTLLDDSAPTSSPSK